MSNLSYMVGLAARLREILSRYDSDDYPYKGEAEVRLRRDVADWLTDLDADIARARRQQEERDQYPGRFDPPADAYMDAVD